MGSSSLPKSNWGPLQWECADLANGPPGKSLSSILDYSTDFVTGDSSSIPGSGRSPGVGNSNPLQYSCLENSMDRGTWWAIIVPRVEKNWTLWVTECAYCLSFLLFFFCIPIIISVFSSLPKQATVIIFFPEMIFSLYSPFRQYLHML